MIEIIYISRFYKQSKEFIENLLIKLEEKNVKDFKYIPRNIMIETGKFKVYGLPISSSCLGLNHSKVKYYIDEMFVSDIEVTKNEYERYKNLLQTFPKETRKIKYEDLMKILESK